jgi:hypothetical protein
MIGSEIGSADWKKRSKRNTEVYKGRKVITTLTTS